MTARKKRLAPKKRAAKVPTVLVLRTCDSELRSHGGFQWPASGEVSAPDWSPVAECGRGLHGLLWGEGNGDLLSWNAGARWLVVEVDAGLVVDLGGKVKFPRGRVVHCGDRLSATSYLAKRAPGRAIVGATATAGYRGTATAGDRGTATAGNDGTATAGNDGTATAGYRGTATAGNGGTATAGDRGTATAGNGGTATAGNGGTATAGNGGAISIRWWDEKRGRYRIATGYVDEDGIEARIAYVVEGKGKLVRKAVTP